MTSEINVQEQTVALGEGFLAALAARDFDHLEALFGPSVRFRAMLPRRVGEGKTAGEAVDWFRRWFGDTDELEVLQSATSLVVGRLYLNYRLRVHDVINGWRVIEQHAYADVQDSRIADMWLLCSGFRLDLDNQFQEPHPSFKSDVFYDAGARGCADGPLEEIAGLMRRMSAGQTLEVHATAASVAADLPAWCRLTGYELVKQEGQYYLIRR